MKPKFGVKRSKAMKSYQGKITTSIKYVVIAMSMTVAVSTSQADVVKKQIGDLEIYALPTPGNPNIMMMLDISGSMDSALSGCKKSTTQTIDTPFVYTDATDSTKTFTTTISNLQSCTSSTTNKTIYNRINSLKVALVTLLTNNTVSNDIGLGIGVFSYNGDGKTGIIRYPIQKLTMANRQLMANYVAGLTATGGTPTPSAFAEAGAYMLGTKTSGTGSGFRNSDNITKIQDKTRYLQGAQQTTCAGNGIYLLTDGEPNTSVTATQAQALMNTSLSTTATKVTNCELLPDGTRGALGWGCMANYGQILA